MSDSMDWETEDDWKDKVCQPIIDYNLAPRDALAILEFFGKLGDEGIRTLLDEIIKKWFKE